MTAVDPTTQNFVVEIEDHSVTTTLVDSTIEGYVVEVEGEPATGVVSSEIETIIVEIQDFSVFVVGDEPVTPVVEVDVVQGLPGPAGPVGPIGPPGNSAEFGIYYSEFNFAVPIAVWRIEHNQNTFALNLETLDSSGDVTEGNVRFIDNNTIEVDWYYPTAGTARLFR